MKLKNLMINEKGFVFDPFTGSSFGVSEAGVKILEWMNQTTDSWELASKLSHEYEIEVGEAYNDIVDFVMKLKIYGLVEVL